MSTIATTNASTIATTNTSAATSAVAERVARASIAFGASPHHAEAQIERRQIVAQVVREHGHQLVGHRAPALLDRVARRILRQLGALREHADPARDALHEGCVLLFPEVGLTRRADQHAA